MIEEYSYLCRKGTFSERKFFRICSGKCLQQISGILILLLKTGEPATRRSDRTTITTMSLKSRVESDIKDAMRAKDQDKLRALRAIKSLILLEETSGHSTGELSEDTELKLLTKAAKQRRESAEIYQAQGREDLWSKEEAELAIIEQFMPRQLTEDEIKFRLEDIIGRVGASGPADMGKVMGVATKELAGQADGRMVSSLVKSLLAK